jgi:hypothetical protein
VVTVRAHVPPLTRRTARGAVSGGLIRAAGVLDARGHWAAAGAGVLCLPFLSLFTAHVRLTDVLLLLGRRRTSAPVARGEADCGERAVEARVLGAGVYEPAD